MRTTRVWPAWIAIVGGMSSPALACGVCVLGMMDLYAPPAMLWFLLPLSWFVLTGAASTWLGVSLPLQPGLLVSVALALGAFLAGAAAVGPLATLPLMVPPVIAFFRALRVRRSGEGGASSGRLRKIVVGIGVAHLALIVVGIALLVQTRRTRSDAEYICRWSETTLARARFQALQPREPASLPEYRYIVENGSDRIVAEAAERLAEIGSPSEDDALLDRALARNAANSAVAGRIAVAKQRLDARRPG